MDVLGDIMLMVGIPIAIVGEIWFFIEAFSKSKSWGFGCILPPVFLIFLIIYWSEGSKPFFVMLGGWVLIIIGYLISGAGTV